MRSHRSGSKNESGSDFIVNDDLQVSNGLITDLQSEMTSLGPRIRPMNAMLWLLSFVLSVAQHMQTHRYRERAKVRCMSGPRLSTRSLTSNSGAFLQVTGFLSECSPSYDSLCLDSRFDFLSLAVLSLASEGESSRSDRLLLLLLLFFGCWVLS